MKKCRKIVFGIILFLAVLFCYGINSYSLTNSNIFGAEHSSKTNCVENCLSSDIDHFEDDQIFHAREFGSETKHLIILPVALNFFLIQTFSLPVWQPPQSC